ncbi:MAG: AAA family ATPase [Patescibacteria group bacterium]
MTQLEALEILKTGRNVFLTGPAGSGKTHLTNSYIAYLKKNDIDPGITASTGIAATHMGGMTIHSWAGIGVKDTLDESDLEAMAEKPYLSKRFEKVRVLIIDEVSMLHHFRLDLVDQVLRTMKGTSDPFGGVQVVLVGDFFQLPPVQRGFSESGEETQFVYHGEAWKQGDFTVCYLSEQFRQKDDSMIDILNEIRSGDVSDASKKLLETRMGKTPEKGVRATKLFTHNMDVDALNALELEKLQSPEEALYVMSAKGHLPIVEILKKSCLAPEKLKLKLGAAVMCVKNNFEEGYVNGTLGMVVSCKKSLHPVIRTTGGREITIEPASWKIEEDGKVKAEITQYPLRHAWGITVHKSQGMSLDAVEVDLSKAFEPGMGYVALSRVRSLAGLSILGLNATALMVHEDVLLFDRELQEQSSVARKTILKNTEKLHGEQKDFLEWAVPKSKGGSGLKLAPHELTALLIEERKSLKDMASERGVTTETILTHIEKLISEGVEPDIAYLKKEISFAHWKKIEKAINEILETDDEVLLSKVKNKVGPNVSYLHIRLGRVLLGCGPRG